jgi:glucose/arabinose dehydrogenase
VTATHQRPPLHPWPLDAQGGLYVNLGSATNACQVQNHLPHSPGYRPCTELETRAGIWRYDADRTGQLFCHAHWAPNDLLLYNGHQFLAAYRGGAFIALHGSWNRATFPQGGYNVVFQPLADGKRAGKYVVFAFE